MTEKIIFLDFDGVVLLFHEREIAPERAAVLTEARNRGFKFILHSTKRLWLYEVEMLLERVGHKLDGSTSPDIPSKRAAICTWLYENYGDDWPECVVVDDDEIEAIQNVRIVKVDPRVGLRKEDIE